MATGNPDCCGAGDESVPDSPEDNHRQAVEASKSKPRGAATHTFLPTAAPNQPTVVAGDVFPDISAPAVSPLFMRRQKVRVTSGPLCCLEGEIIAIYVYPDADPTSQLQAPWCYVENQQSGGWIPQSLLEPLP